LPRGFALEDFHNDVYFYERLFSLRLAILTLADKTDDTYFAATFVVYPYVKTHHPVTGAVERSVDDLGRRFVRNGRSTTHQGASVPA
jgi:hypothetical protein